MIKENSSKNCLSLVLPCFNPPKNWEINVVNTVLEIEKITGANIYLILVNDGSSKEILSEKINFIEKQISNFLLVDYPINHGKGYALRKGVEKVTHFPIIYTDIDFPYTEDSLMAVYNELLNEKDVVLGHRGKEYYTKTPFIRKMVSKILRWFLKTFLRLPTDDSQCGIKGFNQKGAEAFLSTKINRFLFDLEFIKIASKRKLNCQTVTVQLKPNIVFSKVNFKILATESINFMKVLFRRG